MAKIKLFLSLNSIYHPAISSFVNLSKEEHGVYFRIFINYQKITLVGIYLDIQKLSSRIKYNRILSHKRQLL